MRFFAGLLVGLFALAGYLGYERYFGPPCGGRCGSQTQCVEGLCLLVAEPREKKRRKRRRRGRRRARKQETATHEARPATAAERRPKTRGQSLRQTDYLNMASKDEGRELSQTEVTAKIRQVDARIVACIDGARSDNVALKRGRVQLSFRIERTGAIKKVKVTAPALLMNQGLYRCIRNIVVSLRFPASSRSMIMTYPYRLH